MAKLALLCAAAVIVFAGCGRDQTGRVPVEGAVTFEGQPVAWGSITLRPAPGTSGPAAGSEIVDGKFEIPASAGPQAGSYVARIVIARVAADSSATNPIAKGPRDTRTFELPVGIRADREEYDLSLPVDGNQALQKRAYAT